MPDWYRLLLAKRDRPETFIDFSERFLSAPRVEREQIASSWDPDLEWALPNPRRLACSGEGPGSAQQRIRADALFQALGFGVEGVRESLVGLAVVYHSARLAGMNSAELFREVAHAVGGKGAEALLAFASRDPEDRSMDAFALTAVETPGGGYELRVNW